MDIDEFFKKRLLRKISIDANKIRISIKIAEDKLQRAEKLFSSDFFQEAFVNAYTCMFHASRALLYSKGIQEKSHFAVLSYLKYKFRKEIPEHLIQAFSNYQLERHNIFYGFNIEITKEKAENIILDAEEFLEKIQEILNNEN